MKIVLTSVFVDDQAKALAFYTEKLGFEKRQDVPVGEDRWLTVASPEQPDGPELLLEPNRHPAAQAFQQALVKDNIPATSFDVTDLEEEHARLTGLGVVFRMPPTQMGPVRIAVLEDTCGNLIQLAETAG